MATQFFDAVSRTSSSCLRSGRMSSTCKTGGMGGDGSTRVEVVALPGLSKLPMDVRYEAGALRPTLLLESPQPVLAALVLQSDESLVFSRMRHEDAVERLRVEVDVLRFDPAFVRKPFVLVEHVQGVGTQVRLPIGEPSQPLVQSFVRARPLPSELRTGTWFSWADTPDAPSVKVSLIVVALADTVISHGRWRARLEPRSLPADVSWLATGKRCRMAGF